MHGNDQQWHDSFKPSWGPEATLLYASSGNERPSKRAATNTNNVIENMTTFVSEARDIQIARFAGTSSVGLMTLTCEIP